MVGSRSSADAAAPGRSAERTYDAEPQLIARLLAVFLWIAIATTGAVLLVATLPVVKVLSSVGGNSGKRCFNLWLAAALAFAAVVIVTVGEACEQPHGKFSAFAECPTGTADCLCPFSTTEAGEFVLAATTTPRPHRLHELLGLATPLGHVHKYPLLTPQGETYAPMHAHSAVPRTDVPSPLGNLIRFASERRGKSIDAEKWRQSTRTPVAVGYMG
jgi:hypothetical protein